jgi:hypothetical protein
LKLSGLQQFMSARLAVFDVLVNDLVLKGIQMAIEPVVDIFQAVSASHIKALLPADTLAGQKRFPAGSAAHVIAPAPGAAAKKPPVRRPVCARGPGREREAREASAPRSPALCARP